MKTTISPVGAFQRFGSFYGETDNLSGITVRGKTQCFLYDFKINRRYFIEGKTKKIADRIAEYGVQSNKRFSIEKKRNGCFVIRTR